MKNLKQLRKAKGFTQKRLGELVGVSESAINQYENGKRLPYFEVQQML